MKESEFIEQNKEKWLEFENNLSKNDADPSKTSKLFVQITDDLSYARTFYKNRSVRLYLNGTAKVLFNELNKSDKLQFSSFLNFWKKDLPLTVFYARRAMLISFLVFVSCFILGVITSIYDKDFARSILSNDYVNMTNENIAKGDPMAVYKSESELRTFLPILYNNLRVDFMTFFSGVFMAIGTLVIMVVNGVMVGVFQYFFIERGLFWESFLGIWTHGALEISSIIICGGAGLTLGKGLLFPGTYTRFQAFKVSGMNGLKILMGVVPITFLAAFIEGFLTRHTDIPDPVRFVFILLSFAFILLYFFYYPRRVAKQYPEADGEIKNLLIYKNEEEFDPAEIYPTVKIITKTFHLLFKHFTYFGKLILVLSLFSALLLANNPVQLFYEDGIQQFNLTNFFDYGDFPFMGMYTTLVFLAACTGFLPFLKKKLIPAIAEKAELSLRNLLSLFFGFGIYAFIIFTKVDFSLLLAHVLFPFIIFTGCVSHYQKLPFYASMGYAASLISQSWGRFLLTALVFSILSLILYSTSVYGLRILFLQDALVWVLTNDEGSAAKIAIGFSVFLTCASFLLYLTLLVISNTVLFFSLKEAYTAEHLIAKIKSIRLTK